MIGKFRAGIARSILIGLVGLLLAGIAFSMWMSMQARSAAERTAIEQAKAIASQSLALVFEPNDLNAPVSDTRAAQLTRDVSDIVIDPSDYTAVTVWSEDGVILYSTEAGRIGNLLAGERDRIGLAIRGQAVPRDSNGEFSVMVPLVLRSSVGPDVAVELVRPNDTIAAAAGPWRTNALFLAVLLFVTGFAVFGVTKMQAALGAATSFPRTDAPQPGAQAHGRMPLQRTRAPTLEPPRPIEVPSPGLREEAEARKMAEERARAAEERLALLHEQYKKSLDDLQTLQQMAREASTKPDPRLEERALRAEGLVRTLEGQVRSLKDERERLADQLDDALTAAERAPRVDPAHERRANEAVQEAIGLRAELEGAQTQLSVNRRELRALQDQAGRSTQIQEDLDAAHLELGQTRDALGTARADLRAARAEMEDGRAELRALRGEEQRAAVLQDELRAAKAEILSGSASHRAELVEREAELEEKVRTAREQFQKELAAIEASYREQLSLKEEEFAGRIKRVESESSTAGAELTTAMAEVRAVREELASHAAQVTDLTEELASRAAEVEGLKAELSTRDEHATGYLAELDGARTDLATLREELAATQGSLAGTQAELMAAQSGATESGERASRTELENRSLTQRLERMAGELEDAAAENADLNRKLQEVEARRALELADDPGRSEIDELLRVTQDRLAGQTEKLMAAEDRIHDLEHEIASRSERLDEVEAQLRQHQMHDALREIREPARDETAGEADGVRIDEAGAFEDRRAVSPFTKELSLDAKKSLTRIMGITQILKHKKDGKDHAQLIKQLTAHVRRLDQTVANLAEADELARGTIELAVKRTNIEALVQRIVEESGISAEHEVRLETEEFSLGIDPQRTEQIVAGLLRSSSDRTPNGKGITVRLSKRDGGALISVEDPEPSSDASLSPLITRFAEVQGGWATVESREQGGSAFRVFLPDGAPQAAKADDVQIVVDEHQPQEWEPSAEQILVQELHRLAEKD